LSKINLKVQTYDFSDWSVVRLRVHEQTALVSVQEQTVLVSISGTPLYQQNIQLGRLDQARLEALDQEHHVQEAMRISIRKTTATGAAAPALLLQLRRRWR
jgi:hypothetical protein